MRSLLKKDRAINVNAAEVMGWTALHAACDRGLDSIASLCLAHPRVDVNLKDDLGRTAFLLACAKRHTSCVYYLLLKDSRVWVNEPDNEGHTPLWWACLEGHLATVKLWIASGTVIELGISRNEKNDAVLAARRRGRTEMVTLLSKFQANEIETRNEVRKELRITSKNFRVQSCFTSR